jgi:hypothetical protein
VKVVFFWEYFWRSSGALLPAAVGAGGVGKQSALQRALFFVASSFWRSFVSFSEDSARNIFTERSFSSELQWFHRSEVCTDAAFSLLCEFALSLSLSHQSFARLLHCVLFFPWLHSGDFLSWIILALSLFVPTTQLLHFGFFFFGTRCSGFLIL